MKTLTSAIILMICLTSTMAQEAAPVSTSDSEHAALVARARADAARSRRRLTGERPGGDLLEQAQSLVLVVPTAELAPQDLATITEDMVVMCRIFDKALGAQAASAVATQAVISTRSSGRVETLRRLLAPQTQRTQGLYLDGYGAVFFIPVDFALMPPPEAPEPPEAEPSADPVWSAAMSELRGRPQETERDDRRAVSYDPQRVENLKTTLIRTLRHAANVRARRPEDSITLVIGAQARAAYGQIGWQLNNRYDAWGPYGSPVPGSGRNAHGPDNLRVDPAGTLILRASKSDIDAFGAGTSTFEQFAVTVQSLWSSYAQGIAEQPPAPSSLSR